MTSENTPKPGVYKHYKGNLYEVLAVARHSETEEQLVVYKALYGDRRTWIRPLAMFCEEIEQDGERLPRFQFIEDSESDGVIQR